MRIIDRIKIQISRHQLNKIIPRCEYTTSNVSDITQGGDQTSGLCVWACLRIGYYITFFFLNNKNCEISISVGRVVLELWEHMFPSTVANFIAIAKGSARGSTGNTLSYKVSFLFVD